MRILLALLLISIPVEAQARPDLTTILRQGVRLSDAGQLSAAQELYEKALSSFPADPDLRFELGMVYFREGNWAKAVENYKVSVSGQPRTIKPLFYLSEAYFMESDLDQARETIAQAARIAPDDAQVCQKYGEYLSANLETRQEGLVWLKKARRIDPNLAQIDFDIGKDQFELTDFQSATVSLEAALKKHPGDGRAAFYLAEAWANLGDWEKARSNYSDALSQGYANAETYYGLGRSQAELGEFESAVDPLRRALVMQPSLIQAHFQLGKVYRQLGRTDDARDETKLYAAMVDRVDTSSELKGSEEQQAWRRVRPLLEENKEAPALELLAKLPVAHQVDGGDPYYLLGVMYFSMGRKDDARRLLTTAKTRNTYSARIAAYLGLVELSSGDTDMAEESLRSALSENSAETLALIGMGGLRYQQQRWGQAAEYLEKSRTADPNTLLMLCDAYFRIGRMDDARLTSQVIRALASDNKPLLARLDELMKPHHAD
jgi:tetratricopeptide (TPR) repeat protein